VAVTKEFFALDKSNVKLSLTVPKDEVQTQYKGVLNDYIAKAQLPGFRKGKVPREVLERKFGEILKGETLSKIMENAVSEIFKDESLSRYERPLPYCRPALEGEPKLDFEQDLVFSLVYDVLPRLNVSQWKGFQIEAPEAGISDEDIARELEEIRQRNALEFDREEGEAAQKGDKVTINYLEIDENGEALPDTEQKGFTLILGSGFNFYKIDDDIAGMKKGETKDITKAYPADFEIPALAGKTKTLRVTLTALREISLSALNDELAQDVDEKFQTLDDLKSDIRVKLENKLHRRLREIKVDRLLEKIIETAPVVIPESMLRLEMENRWRLFARQFNAPVEGILDMMAKSEGGIEKIEDGWLPSCTKALHARLVVETLIEELGLEASDEELEKTMESMAAEASGDLEAVKKYYQEENARFLLKEDIKERKLFDILIAENTVKAGKRETYLDLMANNG
jgi:trigger factor